MRRPRLLVPVVSLAMALAVGPMLTATALAADPTVVVRPGDTLTGIAARHGITLARLVEINDLSDPNRIYAGQRLRLRPADSRPRSSGSGRSDTSAAKGRAHTVRFGEHLTGIGRHYGVTVAAIVAANRIANPSRIYVGQRLEIPGRRGAADGRPSKPAKPKRDRESRPASPAPKARTHIVRFGEHLTGIARHYGVPVSAIVAVNDIANPSRIFVGQRLAIPGARPPSAGRDQPKRSALPASMRALMDRRESVRRAIAAEARRYGVPVPIALAVAWQESGWQQGVVSHAGAIGVMQIMPATGTWIGEAMLGRRVDLGDMRQNVRAGVRLLAHYLDRYDGNLDLVLAAYYQGQTAADRHGVYPISRPYVASIRALVRLFGG